MNGRKTILICDDEPALRELIRASMDEGYEFAEASDGIIAMELAHEVEPDLVILDLMLPRLSGLEVLARMNADEDLKDVPVLVITAWNETREDVLSAGADEFVAKPFDPEDLRAAVNKLVAA
jgi:DNA-binding response OmpR family regulator